MTAPYLFAPDKYIPGNNRCYYCGLECGNEYNKSVYVKKTFTNRDIVKFPGSDFVCGCCVASMDTIVDTTLVDGEVKTGRGGAPRTYSWVLSTQGNTAFSKKHLDYARKILSCPPAPPFSIVLAESGKKQIIFRAPVNNDREWFVVQLEEEQIEIDAGRWEHFLKAATLASAAIGKKALLSPEEFTCFLNTVKYFGDETILEEWIEIHNEPMARIAAWVCKGKKDARDEDFVSARVQTEACGSDRLPNKRSKCRDDGGSERKRGQLLFDFA
jgi:CRISPR type IV-associated protein Csf1